MAVNYAALASTFTATPADRLKEQKYLNTYYCLRQLMWKGSTKRIFREAIECGALQPVAPGRRQDDGSYSRAEYDDEEVKAMFDNAREEFYDQFDAAFKGATLQELFVAAKKFFALDKKGFINAIADYVAEREQREQVRQYSR